MVTKEREIIRAAKLTKQADIFIGVEDDSMRRAKQRGKN